MFAAKEVNVKGLKKEERAHALNEIRLLASMKHPVSAAKNHPAGWNHPWLVQRSDRAGLRLQSQNITAYHEAFLDGNKLVVIMEYCKNGDLSEFITKKRQRHSPMTTEAIWMYFIQICRGVHEMHQADVVHRDIKPANILRAGGGVVKLADLGVAKFLKADLAHTVIGTPYYMPPELWKQKPYNESSDVWALGCLLYEMAAFKVPFDGRSIQDLQHRICHSNPTRLPSGCPEEIRKVINLCLKKRPGDRPSVKELLEMPEIRRHAGGVPTVVQPRYALDEEVRDPSLPPSTAGSHATNASSVMDTIKCPVHLGQDNWKRLNQVLPAANYPLLAATHPLPAIDEGAEPPEEEPNKAASDPTPHRAPRQPAKEIRISEQALARHREKKRQQAAARAMPALAPINDGTLSHPPPTVKQRRKAGRFEYLTPRGGRRDEPDVVVHDQYDMHGRRRHGGRGVKAYEAPPGARQLDGAAGWKAEMADKLRGMEAAVGAVGGQRRGHRKAGGLPLISEHGRAERKALVPLHPNKGLDWGKKGGEKARVGQGGAGIMARAAVGAA